MGTLLPKTILSDETRKGHTPDELVARAPWPGRAGCGGSLGETPSGGHTPLRAVERGSQVLSPWLREVAEKRQRACLLMKKLHVEQGIGLLKASRIIARRFRGRRLKSRPRHRMALTSVTALRIYHHWRKNGETPSALILNFRFGRRFIDATLLIRFVNFAADRRWPSFKAAWLAFCQRGGSYGPGRVSGRKLALRYDALRWNLPRGCFAQMQREWKTISQAEKKIAALREKFIREIRQRVPAKLPRRQTQNASDFSI